MLLIIFAAAMAGIGCIAGTSVSRLPGRKLPWILPPLILACSMGLWLGALYLYSRYAGLPMKPGSLFPDRLSKLLLSWLILPISLLVGLVAGWIRAGGMRHYFRASAGSKLRRAAFGCVCIVSLALVLAGAALSDETPPSPLRISEACCCNFGLKKDPATDDYEDYIELINTGEEPIDLGGYFLSDQIKKRSKFRLPEITLEPGEYLLLWADGVGRSGEMSETSISLNFTLKPGETVYLSSPHGILIDTVTLPEKGAKAVYIIPKGM